MSVKAHIAAVFPVRPAERGRLVLCSLIYLLIIGGVIFGRNARDSLFLKYVGIAYLPWMYVLNAVAVVACSLAYAAFVDRVERARFIAVTSALFVGSLVGARLAILHTGPGQALRPAMTYTALYALAQVIWLLSVMQFWTFAGDLFDTRESKRLFPLINAGGLMGMVAAGFGGKALVACIGTENLLIAWAVALLIAAAGIQVVHRQVARARRPAGAQRAPRGAPARHSMREDLADGLEQMRESRLLRTVAWITLAQWIVYTLVDYLFSAQAKAHYPDKDALTQFLGAFSGCAGLTALVLQLFVTTRVIAWLGVGRTIQAHPAFLVGSTAWMTGAFGFLSATFTKFGDHVCLYTAQESSYQLLYSPVPLAKRGRLRAFVEGYVKPTSMGIAGLILVLAALFLKPAQLAGVSAALSVAWLLLARRVGRAYVKALVDNLQSDTLSGAIHDLRSLKDDQAIAVLVSSLGSKDNDVVVCALDILGRMQAREAREAVQALLNRKQDRVRRAALGTLGRIGDPAALPAVLPCLGDPSARVRAQAADALGRIGDESAAPAIGPLLGDPDPDVRGKAAAALIQVGGIDGVLQAAETIRAMLNSQDAGERKAVASLLGSVRIRYFLPPLLNLVHDPEPDVRAAAVKALGQIADPRALPELLPLLGDRRVHRRARKAVLNIGAWNPQAVQQAVAGSLQAAREGDAVRQAHLEILAHFPGDAVLPVALGALDDPSGHVRSRALATVAACIPVSSAPKAVGDRLRAYAHAEMRATYENVRASALLARAYGAGPAAELLNALRVEKRECQERVLEALALMGDTTAIRRISREIWGDNPRARADALEALENLGYREITVLLLPTLDEQEPELALERCRQVLGDGEPAPEEMLNRIAGHPDVWVRACVAYFAGKQHLAGCRGMAERLLADPDPLVRETALEALAAICPNDVPGIAAPLEQDPAPAVRRQAERICAGAVPGMEEIMLSTMEKLLFLKSVSFFDSLDGEDLLELAERTEVRRVPAGESLYQQGDDADSLYIVVKGHVVIQRQADKESVDLAHVGEHGYFGELSLLDGAPHTTTAVAVEDSTVLSLNREEFRDLVKERPEAALGAFKEMARRLRQYRDEARAAGEPPEQPAAAPDAHLRA